MRLVNKGASQKQKQNKNYTSKTFNDIKLYIRCLQIGLKALKRH